MASIELDQAFESPLTVYRRGGIMVRFASGRSKDSLVVGERAQDFVNFRICPQRVAFSVCDGVGNSFFGGLAAQIVGISIVEWLWKQPLARQRPEPLSEPAALSKALEDYLNGCVELGQRIVERKDLSKFENAFQVAAYRNQIKNGGTQSNFVAGLLEAPSTEQPDGSLLLFWLGDARLKLYHAGEQRTHLLGAEWSDEEGWSSLRGVHGAIHVFSGTLLSADCVIAHTDGLLPVADELRPGLPSEFITAALSDLQKRPESDDMSFVEISVAAEVFEATDDIAEQIRAWIASDQSPSANVGVMPQTVEPAAIHEDSPANENSPVPVMEPADPQPERPALALEQMTSAADFGDSPAQVAPMAVAVPVTATTAIEIVQPSRPEVDLSAALAELAVLKPLAPAPPIENTQPSRATRNRQRRKRVVGYVVLAIAVVTMLLVTLLALNRLRIRRAPALPPVTVTHSEVIGFQAQPCRFSNLIGASPGPRVGHSPNRTDWGEVQAEG